MARITGPGGIIPHTSAIEQPTPSDRANGLANPPGQLSETLTQCFPQTHFHVPPDDGNIAVRMIGAHAIAHLRTASYIAEAAEEPANVLGTGETIRLVWQLNGGMTCEDKDRTFAVNAGELFLTRSCRDCFMNVSEGNEVLVVTLDTEAHPAWLNLVKRGEKERMLKPSSAAAASAAGIMALIHQSHHDLTSELALHSLFELATGSVNQGIVDGPSEQVAPTIFRARCLILENIADLNYTPALLAHDLGLSRRSLYNRFADRGITPGAFIRMVRLEQAKREIESDPNGITALTTIALRNGFPDSSSLSHAIKANYGVSPKALRSARAGRFWRG